MGDRRNGSLRVALGHRAVVRKYNEVIAEPQQDSPPPQQRRRSSLSADTTFLEELHIEEEPQQVASENKGGEGAAIGNSKGGTPSSETHEPQRLSVGSNHSYDSGASSPCMGDEGEAGRGAWSPSTEKENGRGASHQQVGTAEDRMMKGMRDGGNNNAVEPRASPSANDMEVVTEDEHLQSNYERESAVVADRMLAQHYVADRPELKRYDSADAAMKRQLGLGDRARAQPNNEGGSDQQSYKGMGELALPGTIPTPLRTEHGARGTSSPPSHLHNDAGPAPSGAGRFIEITLSPAASPVHIHTGHSNLSKELDEFGPLRPMLTHFDSADYYMSEKVRQQQAEEEAQQGKTAPLMAAEIKALEARMQQKASAAVDDDEFLPKPFGLQHFDSADHFMEERKTTTNAEGFEKEPIDNRLNGFRLGSTLEEAGGGGGGEEEMTGHKAAASFLLKKIGGKR